MLVYKIRNPDGLFSAGGPAPRWTKQGKTWTNIGHVKTHLNRVNIRHGYYRIAVNKTNQSRRPEELVLPEQHPYTGCRLIVYELKALETRHILDLL